MEYKKIDNVKRTSILVKGEKSMAKFFDKFLDSMRLTEEDDEDDYFLEEEDDELEDKIPKRNLFKRQKFSEDMEEDFAKPKITSRPTKVLPIRSTSRELKVCLIKPSSEEESKEICDTLLTGRVVILNLEGLDLKTAQRIIDFASGACYSINGNMQQVSAYIFVVSPEAVELSGDFQGLITPSEKGMGSFASGNLRLNI